MDRNSGIPVSRLPIQVPQSIQGVFCIWLPIIYTIIVVLISLSLSLSLSLNWNQLSFIPKKVGAGFMDSLEYL